MATDNMKTLREKPEETPRRTKRTKAEFAARNDSRFGISPEALAWAKEKYGDKFPDSDA
ncbi:hypothetical protein [Cyanobium sp. Morenito 9A2]|uniref:hypothetical protein n=1 Tax=Cyanobium sp. Morenito 9A2 TaxID=2823718 RepID=UPI0020CD2936|nr:hypothetical protein [Cyanobium sp. Morenito 9A2]MCP9850777.1 hypothetical protein [Cyanobium sp. Morenito 9A2]